MFLSGAGVEQTNLSKVIKKIAYSLDHITTDLPPASALGSVLSPVYPPKGTVELLILEYITSPLGL